MPMCTVVSCVVGRGCLLWPVCSLGKTVSLCPASFCTPWPNLPVTPGISWFPTFAFLSPLMKRTSLFGVGSRRSCRSSQNHSTLTSSALVVGHRLGLLWYWMVCLGNEQRSSCHSWDCTQYCISDSFVDYDGYSISSKGFLPTVVEIMFIWIKFTRSIYFSSLIPKMSMFTLATACLITSSLPWLPGQSSLVGYSP